MRLISILTLVACIVPALPADAQRLKWTFQTGGAIYASPTVASGSIYVGSEDGYLYAVSAKTGAQQWRFQTGGPVDATPVVKNGVVYVACRDGFFYALDARHGTLNWKFQTGGEKKYDFWDFSLSTPVLHEDLVLFGSGDGHLYALDRKSGTLRWKVQTGDAVHARPVVANGIVYFGSFDGVFYAVQAASGEQVWTFDTIGATYFPEGAIQRGAAVDDGVVYFGSRDYNIYAVDAETGTGHWNMKDPRGWIIARPLVHEGSVYVGTSDPRLFYAMDAQSGRIRWTCPVNTRVFGAAVKIGETLYFGGHNGKLYAVGAETGAIRWTFQTAASKANYASVYDETGEWNDEMQGFYEKGNWRAAEKRLLSLGSILGTPVVQGRTLFFGSTDGKLYAVEIRDK